MSNEMHCDRCKEETSRKELGSKVRGRYLCKECKKEVKKEHREKTIQQAGIADDLREFDNKLKRAWNHSEKGKEYYRNYSRKKKEEQEGKTFEPKIKGSKQDTKKKRSNAYLTFEERQYFLKQKMDNGLSFEKAKEEVDAIVDEQRRIRELMEQENISEKEIKFKQAEMIQELFNN